MPPQKSAVWNYFKRSLNGNTVKCTLCDAQLTFCGVTTNLTSFSANLQTSLKLKTSQSYKVICSTSLTQKNPHSGGGLIEKPNIHDYQLLQNVCQQYRQHPFLRKRFCSSAGLIVTKLRNRLSSEVVDQIIFLNKNKIKVPRNEPHIIDQMYLQRSLYSDCVVYGSITYI